MIERGMATEMISVLRKITEENQDDHCGQQRSVQPLLDEVADRLADVDDWSKEMPSFTLGNADHRPAGPYVRIHHCHGVGDGLFVYPADTRLWPVRPDYVGLNVRRISHSPDIRTRTGLPCGLTFTINVLDRVDRAELIIGENVVSRLPAFNVARREDQIWQPSRI